MGDRGLTVLRKRVQPAATEEAGLLTLDEGWIGRAPELLTAFERSRRRRHGRTRLTPWLTSRDPAANLLPLSTAMMAHQTKSSWLVLAVGAIFLSAVLGPSTDALAKSATGHEGLRMAQAANGKRDGGSEGPARTTSPPGAAVHVTDLKDGARVPLEVRISLSRRDRVGRDVKLL